MCSWRINSSTVLPQQKSWRCHGKYVLECRLGLFKPEHQPSPQRSFSRLSRHFRVWKRHGAQWPSWKQRGKFSSIVLYEGLVIVGPSNILVFSSNCFSWPAHAWFFTLHNGFQPVIGLFEGVKSKVLGAMLVGSYWYHQFLVNVPGLITDSNNKVHRNLYFNYEILRKRYLKKHGYWVFASYYWRPRLTLPQCHLLSLFSISLTAAFAKLDW